MNINNYKTLKVMTLIGLILVFTALPVLAADFFALCSTGTPQQVSDAIKAGAQVNQLDDRGRTPLMVAARDNANAGVIDVLIDAGAFVNVSDLGGWTALMYATTSNTNPDAVTVLVRASANVNVINSEGDSALLLAARRGHVVIINTLLNAGANVNVKAENGLTPLQIIIAAEKPELAIVDALLNAGAQVNVKNSEGNSPLMVEIGKSETNMKIVEMLLKAGADANIKNKEGFTALTLEVNGNCSLTIIKMLINSGADVNTRDGNGWTLLMHAARQDKLSIVEFFVMLDSKIDVRNNYGETALIIAGKYRSSIDILNTLLKRGADPGLKDNEGWTVLMYAAKNRDTRAITSLVLEHVDINDTNIAKQTPLMIAISHGANREVVELLLYYGAKINHQDKDGWSPLIYAVKSRNIEVVHTLLSVGAHVNMQNNSGQTAFSLAIKNHDLEIAQVLVNAGANINMVDDKWNTPLLSELQNRSIFGSSTEVVSFLIKVGADVNVSNKEGYTPLMYAILAYDDPAIIRMLLAAGAEPDATLPFSGRTPLMLAAQNTKNQEIIFILLEFNASATMRDNVGKRVVDYLEENTALKGTQAYWQLNYLEPNKTLKDLESLKSVAKGALLAVIPSAGHAYAGNWWPKGTLFLAGEVTLLAIGLNQQDPTAKLIFLGGAGLLKVWEIYDVIQEINQYNEKMSKFNQQVEEFNAKIMGEK